MLLEETVDIVARNDLNTYEPSDVNVMDLYTFGQDTPIITLNASMD
jgi:hypothetical protein